MRRIKKKKAFLWSLGMLLGIVLSTGASRLVLAQEAPAIPGESSLTVLSSAPLTPLCTSYSLITAEGRAFCGVGFIFPRSRVLLDQKTGDIWMETVQPGVAGFNDPKGGPFGFFFPIVRNEITMCRLGNLGTAGKLDPEMTVNSYPVDYTVRREDAVCPR